MNKIHSGVCKRKIWVIPSKKDETEKHSRYVIEIQDQEFSPVELSWHQDKISFVKEISSLLAECNLIPDPCRELDSAIKSKYWQVNKSSSGKCAVGIDFRPEWSLEGDHTAYLYSGNNDSKIGITATIPIFDTTLVYNLSGFFGTHRTSSVIELVPVNHLESKSKILRFVVPKSSKFRGGKKLSDYAFHQWSFDLPKNTVKVELTIKLEDNSQDFSRINSRFLFFTKLFFGVAGELSSAYIPYSENVSNLSNCLSQVDEDSTLGIASLPSKISECSEITLKLADSETELVKLEGKEDVIGALTICEEAIDKIIALDVDTAIAIVRWSQSGKLNFFDKDNQVIHASFGKLSSLELLCNKLYNGENLILNSDFAEGFKGWNQIREARINFSESTRLKNSNCAYLHSCADKETGKLRIYTKDAVMPLTLIADRRYILSGYFGYHRCVGNIGLEWLDNNLHVIDTISLSPNIPESRGGENLQDYDLQIASMICPKGAKHVKIFVEKSSTAPGRKDSFLFFTRLFFGLENTEGETWWNPAKKYLDSNLIEQAFEQEGFWCQELVINSSNINLDDYNLVSINDKKKNWNIAHYYLGEAEKKTGAFLKLEGAIASCAGAETHKLYQQIKADINLEEHSEHSKELSTSYDYQVNLGKSKVLNSHLWLKNWYFNRYPDTVNLPDALQHLLQNGHLENRQPNPYFDLKFYCANSSKDITNPLLHYLETGWRNGQDPSPRFSVNAYLAENHELLQYGQEPLNHLLTNGVRGIEAPAYDLDNPDYYIIPHKTKGSKVVQDSSLRGMIDFERVSLAPEQQMFDSKCLNLHWIIPEFHPGAGGHMTIFRIIRFLELFGHQQTIWINNPKPKRTGDEAFTCILKHFLSLRAKVKYIEPLPEDSSDYNNPKRDFEQAEGDIAIATDWGSVYPALNMSKFKTRFYFVQDYEPMFYPMGSHYLAAEATYKEDLNCICASQWLESLMINKHQNWARSFALAPDSTYYYPNTDAKSFNKTRIRIALYARTFTSRRAVELAILALEVLAKRGIDIHVDFFGEPLNFIQAPFTCSFHGILPIKKLGELYRQCDIGMVFSTTNYSLVPQEMMACGLPVIDLNVESTNITYKPGVVTLAKPLPRSIADAIVYLAENDDIRQKQIDQALDWVSKFTWYDSAKLVEQAFLDRLQELSFQPQSPSSSSTTQIKATVVIPTYNGGALLEKVLQRLSTQTLPWPYEVLIIDSGSQDGTLEIVKKFSQFRLHQIDKKDFGHGKTRNLGATMAKGEYVAFLTQDALPVNDTWLYDTIILLECYPKVAGVFGRHLAYPDASAYTKRDLYNHFSKYENLPLVFNKQLKPEKYGLDQENLQRILHFYSDNNSCFRKSIWQEFPYPDVVYGEDQLWAKHIINLGYSTAYAKNATVYHSHNYNEHETFERSRVEAHFFNQYFGYEMINRGACSTEFVLNRLNTHDIEWGKANGLNNEEISQKCSLNIAGIAGYMQGKKDFDLGKEIYL